MGTFSKHICKGSFYVTSLKCLKHISNKNVFYVLSLRHLTNISWQVFVAFQEYPAKMILFDFGRVNETSNKIDAGPS